MEWADMAHLSASSTQYKLIDAIYSTKNFESGFGLPEQRAKAKHLRICLGKKN